MSEITFWFFHHELSDFKNAMVSNDEGCELGFGAFSTYSFCLSLQSRLTVRFGNMCTISQEILPVTRLSRHLPG
jgi:hypothetical protein